jgi:AraC family transcriptional regulator
MPRTIASDPHPCDEARMALAPALGLTTIVEARSTLASKATIKGRNWNGVSIDKLSSYAATNLVAGPRDHHILTINLADLDYVRSRRCGEVYEGPGRFGEASIHPAGIGSVWDGNIPPHITVRFSQDTLVELTTEIRRCGYPQATIVNHFRIRDPFFENIAALFSLEMERAPHPAQDVLVESLATALLMHVLRGYSSLPRQEQESSRNVAPAALRRALAYIEDQPNIRISLDELAAIAGLSRFHFGRLFRKHIGTSPAAYIEQSRLDRAKAMIRLGQMSLTDIAYALGFADQSHFARRFRQRMGCTPSEYARQFAG